MPDPVQHLKSSYFTSHRRNNSVNLIFMLVGVINGALCSIRIFKHGPPFDPYDAIYPISIVVFVAATIYQLVTINLLSIFDKRLTVVTRVLFFRKEKTYEIDKIEELGVEQVVIIKYPWGKKIVTSDYIVTFFYNDKEIAIDGYLNKFTAMGLYDALIVAKTQENAQRIGV